MIAVNAPDLDDRVGRETFFLMAYYRIKCTTMTIWFPQKNMALD